MKGGITGACVPCRTYAYAYVCGDNEAKVKTMACKQMGVKVGNFVMKNAVH